jgi:hypothetical protein
VLDGSKVLRVLNKGSAQIVNKQTYYLKINKCSVLIQLANFHVCYVQLTKTNFVSTG